MKNNIIAFAVVIITIILVGLALWLPTSSVFTKHPHNENREKTLEVFSVGTNDACVFEIEPSIVYQLDSIESIKYIGYSFEKEAENDLIEACIKQAYRICANKYNAYSLIKNSDEFESEVYDYLKKDLSDKGYILKNLSCKITPPESLMRIINERDSIAQEIFKAYNKVEEAEINRLRLQSQK